MEISCETCALEDKIYRCCGRYPETGAVRYLEVDAVNGFYACPYLNAKGQCTIYERRPYGCRIYTCSSNAHFTRIGLGLGDLLSVFDED